MSSTNNEQKNTTWPISAIVTVTISTIIIAILLVLMFMMAKRIRADVRRTRNSLEMGCEQRTYNNDPEEFERKLVEAAIGEVVDRDDFIKNAKKFLKDTKFDNFEKASEEFKKFQELKTAIAFLKQPPSVLLRILKPEPQSMIAE